MSSASLIIKSVFYLTLAVAYGQVAAHEKKIFYAAAFFPFESIKVSDEGIKQVDIAIEQTKTAFGSQHVCALVVGNAHASEKSEDLQALSLARASKVANIIRLGLPKADVYVEGKGISQPLLGGPNERFARVEVEFLECVPQRKF